MRAAVRVLVAAAFLAVAGCGTGSGAAPEAAARRFEAALAGQDGEGACELLAPETVVTLEDSAGKPCPEAILDEDLPAIATPPTAVEQYGTAAVSRFDEDTVFLGRFRGGWRVTAAGCMAVVGAPYSCTVEGG